MNFPFWYFNNSNSNYYQLRSTQSLEKRGSFEEMKAIKAYEQYLDFGQNAYERIKSEEPSGLRNIGNTCYFNVFLQLLYHINSIRDLFLQSQPSSDLIKSIKELFAKMLFSSLRYSDPTDVFNELKRGGMKVGQQYDFHEYISLTLDTLEKSLASQKGLDGVSQQRYINRIFFGKMNQYFNNGDILTRSVVKFGVITLDAKLKKLQDAFEAFRSYEVEGYKSETGENKLATVRSEITEFPAILTFFVNRVQIEKGKLVKNNVEFSYPQELHLDTDSRIKTKITNEFIEIDNKIKKIEEQLAKKEYHHTVNSLKETIAFLSKQEEFEDMEAQNHTSFGIVGTEESHKQTKDRIQTYINKLEKHDKLLLNRIEELKEQKRLLACKSTSFHYSLFALMIHEGTANSGHYFIIIKNEGTKKWWKFSDRHVSSLTNEQVEAIASGKKHQSTNVCCIFYKQNEFACDPSKKPAIPASLKSWVLNADKELIKNIKKVRNH